MKKGLAALLAIALIGVALSPICVSAQETPKGTIFVSTVPVEGEIYINEEPVGNRSYTSDYEIGNYTVSFGDVEDYKTPANKSVIVRENETVRVNGTYELLSMPTGTISVSTTPVEGNISINSSYVGTGSYIEEYEIGTYTVSFWDVEDYKTPDNKLVTVRENETITVTGTYELLPPKKYSLIAAKIAKYIGAMAVYIETIAVIVAIIVMGILSTFFVLRRLKKSLKSLNQMNSDKIEQLKMEFSDIKTNSEKLDRVITASTEVNGVLKELSSSSDERSAELIQLLQVFLMDINTNKLTPKRVKDIKESLYAWVDKARRTHSEGVEKRRSEVIEEYEKISSHIREKSTYMDMHIFNKVLEKAKRFIETGDRKASEDDRISAYQSANVILQILQSLIEDTAVINRITKLKNLGFY